MDVRRSKILIADDGRCNRQVLSDRIEQEPDAVCSRLNDSPDTARIPVLFMTSNQEKEQGRNRYVQMEALIC